MTTPARSLPPGTDHPGTRSRTVLLLRTPSARPRAGSPMPRPVGARPRTASRPDLGARHLAIPRRLGALAVLVMAVLLLDSGGLPAAEEADSRPAYLGPAEIYDRIEKSEILYEIHDMEDLEGVDTSDLPGAIWNRQAALTWPWVGKDENGVVRPQEYPFSPECLELMKEGEAFYGREEYKEAEKIYRKAARKKPCFLALSHVGDTFYFRRDYEKALKWYEKAIEENPFYSGSWYFKGNALSRLGRNEEARQAYIEALVLRPRKEALVTTLKAMGDEIGVAYFDHSPEPQAFARQEEGKVGVYVDVDSGESWWLIFGLCKALWLGEPGYREERTGDTERPGWSLQEDRECIIATAESYFVLLEAEKVERHAGMERIKRISDRGLLNGYVFYELGSNYSQDLALYVDDAAHEMVRGYVEAYVLPHKPTGPWSPDFP